MLALLVNPNFAGAEEIIRSVQEAARTKRLQLRILKAATESSRLLCLVLRKSPPRARAATGQRSGARISSGSDKLAFLPTGELP